MSKKENLLRVIRIACITLALLGLGFGLGWQAAINGWLVSRFSQTEVVNKEVNPHQIDFSLFWEVWDKLHQDYLDAEKLDDAKMVYGAIKGMTAAIGDPYTVFLPPVDNKAAKEDLNGAFEGVGIQLGFIDSQLAVISPLEGHPAIKVGIRAQDLILHIKDEAQGVDISTQGMSLPEAVKIIRGKKGTEVRLTVLHEGKSEPEEIAVVRDTIVVPSVEVEFGQMDNGQWTIDNETGQVAWLRVYRFGEQTESQWSDAVRKILLMRGSNKRFRGIVLDLRNNPGGFLTGSVFLASEFIADGVIVKQQGKYISHEFEVERNGRLLNIPLVVLINKGSASASEIVAGALRDRLEVKLVGETSFGKGTVQDAQDLRMGAGIHITTARWLLPSGNWISEEGLTPDVEVEYQAAEEEGMDNQLEKAIEMLLK